ncbi:MAG TPA: type II 3-dehydroquinate dehydratase [Gammaproteobacteria bacterium]|nr:type II 3-dehydroquinate dehydratase [Gammaproteobacteria bacterium]HIM04465.1 type II 3-dehydroquinate dehydratase [Gammaproteobacteria bacterium]
MKLSNLRNNDASWRIVLLNGPNTKAAINSVENFDELLQEWAISLGVEIDHFQSNHEGKILEYIHAAVPTATGFLVNPGGLTSVGESLRHALKDSARPTAEIHFDNAELGAQSIFSPSVTSIFSGLHQFSYLGGLVSLVLALDDMDFLNPDGNSATNRSHGTPKSLFV